MLFLAFVLLASVTAEDTGGGKFTEAVTDHIFGNVNGDEFVSVMDCDGKADKVGRDHGCA